MSSTKDELDLEGMAKRKKQSLIGGSIREIDNLLSMIEDGTYEKGRQFRDPYINSKYLKYLHSSPEESGGIAVDLRYKRKDLEIELNELT